MIRPTRALAAVLLAGVVALAGACSSSDDKDGGSKGSDGKALDKVSYVTAFGAVGRDSFVWVAKEKGFFKDAGIDVDIQQGAAGTANLQALKSGKVQFACLDLTGAIIQAGTNKFTDWRAVAAIHQQTLVSIMTTNDTGITRPTDLKGKTVATAAGSVSEQLFPAYAKLAGLDPSTVKIQGAQTTALNGLMAQRKVDALSAFLLSQTALQNISKKPVVVLPYSQYLSDLFGNAIITTPDMIATKKDLVQRFVKAAMQGLQYTVDHPDEAAQILNKAVPTSLVPSAVGEINAMKPYVTPANGAPIGHIDQARLERGITILQGAGLMPAGLTPDKVADFSFVGAS
jgi:NitT/TauT family transport system substrate-binding protein